MKRFFLLCFVIVSVVSVLIACNQKTDESVSKEVEVTGSESTQEVTSENEEKTDAESESNQGDDSPIEIPPYDGPDAKFPNEYPEVEIDPDKEFVLGYMNILRANESLAAVEEAVKKEAERLGMKVISKDNQLDINKQISDMQQLINEGVDAIIYFPIDPNAIVREVEKATEMGIPVFAQDQTFSEDEDPGAIVSQVWQSRDMQAYFAAAAAAQLKPGGNVVGIGQETPVPSIMYMMERMEHYAKEMGLNWITTQNSDTDDASGGQRVMSEILVNNKDIDIVLAYNDSNAQGAMLELKANNFDDAIAIGVNGGSEALNGLKMGRQTVSVRIDTIGIGTQLARGVYGYLTGQIPEEEMPEIVVVPPILMTEENVDSFKTWDEELKE